MINKTIIKFLENKFKTKKIKLTFRSWDGSYSIRINNKKNVIAYYYIKNNQLIINK